MKDVLTTGQAAKICKVAARTVTMWFDRGLLRGYRLPGGRDRRIFRESLLQFIKENGMEIPDCDTPPTISLPVNYQWPAKIVMTNGNGETCSYVPEGA